VLAAGPCTATCSLLKTNAGGGACGIPAGCAVTAAKPVPGDAMGGPPRDGGREARSRACQLASCALTAASCAATICPIAVPALAICAKHASQTSLGNTSRSCSSCNGQQTRNTRSGSDIALKRRV